MKEMLRLVAIAIVMISSAAGLYAQTISSFNPLAARVGSTVVITGTGFSSTASNNTVRFGQETATVSNATSTSLTVVVPVSASYGPISVEVAGSGTAISTLSFDPEFSSGDLSTSSGTLSQTISIGGSPSVPFLVDMDGDGKPDVLITRPSAGTISYLHNTSSSGTISFASPQELSTGTAYSKRIVTADFDGDGRTDFLVVSESGVNLFRNTGTSSNPSFTLWQTFNNPDMTGGSWQVQSGEIELGQSIGILALIVGEEPPSSFPDNSVVWVPNYITNMRAEDVVVADFNGDGMPDFAIAYAGDPAVNVNGRVRVYLTQKVFGITTFNLAYDAEIHQPVFNNELDAYSLAVGDLNGDGRPDLVVGGNFDAFSSSGMVSVLMNVNGNSFVPALNWYQNARTERVVVADFDGDSKPDIGYESIDDHTIRVRRNECSGDTIQFSDPVVLSSTLGENSLQVADYDGDGMPDLVWASEAGGNYIKIARNTSTSGSISFASPVSVNVSGFDFPGAIAVGDLDGDGRPDVVTVKQVSDEVGVIQNEVPPYSLSHSTINMSPDSILKNGTSTATLQIKDVNGNSLSTSGLSVAFSLTGSGTSSGTFGATTNGSGTYSATFTGTAVGTQNGVTANINGSPLSSAPAGITVSAGTASIAHSTITISRSQLAASSSATVCLQARDANGDSLTTGGLTGITFFLTGSGTSSGSFGTVADSGNGKYYTTFTASTSGTARSVSARSSTDTVKTTLPTVTVNAGTFSTSTSVLSVSATSVLIYDSISVTLQVKDGSGNNVTVGGLDVEIQIFGSTNPYDNGKGYLTSVVDNQNGTYSAKFIGLSPGSGTGLIAYIYNPNPGYMTYQMVYSFPSQVTVNPRPFSFANSYVAVSQATTIVGGQVYFSFIANNDLNQAYTQQDITVAITLTNDGTASGSALGALQYTNSGYYSYIWQASGVGTARTLIATVNGDTVKTTRPTITVLPYGTALSYPGHSQTAVPTDTTFSWYASSGATSYRVQIVADSSNGTIIVDSSGITGTQLAVSGLWNYRNYVWRVVVYLDTVQGAYSNDYSFRTVVRAPILASPTPRETNMQTTVPFKWDSTLGANSYELQLATDSLFNTIVSDRTGLTTFIDTLSSLSAGTRYFWRVTASGDGGTSGYSEVRSFTAADHSLAVQATDFKALPDIGSVTLSWRTQSELNNAGFNVLRKDPGSSEFKLISTYASNDSLRGIGTSPTGRSYDFTDNRINSGSKYSYEFQCVSSSGASNYLDTLSVTTAIPKSYALYQNYPNPFNPSTTIRFDLKQSSNVVLEIFNTIGQRVEEFNYGQMNAGRFNESINMSRFASGVYFYRIIVNSIDNERFVSIKKLVLLK
ncbi:MAG TPA: FG-GAP-like repeat-containing protein [Candidatus Kryptonia bacterium]